MNVTFEEQGPIARSPIQNTRGIIGWMLKNNIVKTVSQAQTVLIIGALILFFSAFFIGTSAISKEEVDPHKNFLPAVVR